MAVDATLAMGQTGLKQYSNHFQTAFLHSSNLHLIPCILDPDCGSTVHLWRKAHLSWKEMWMAGYSRLKWKIYSPSRAEA